jgi:hypothetical protein
VGFVFLRRETAINADFVELRQRFVGARQLFSGFAVPLQREIKKQSVWN